MVWYLCVNVFCLKQDFEMYIFGQKFISKQWNEFTQVNILCCFIIPFLKFFENILQDYLTKKEQFFRFFQI